MHWASPFTAQEDCPGALIAEGLSAQPVWPALLSTAPPAGIPLKPRSAPGTSLPSIALLTPLSRLITATRLELIFQ